MNTFRLLISFMLVAIAASSVAGENEVVLDFEGKPVKANAPYFVKHTKGEPRAWISRYGIKKLFSPFSCPQIVVLFSTAIVEPPIPVIFVSSSDVVRVSTEVNIKFTRRGRCRESGFWRVPDSSLPIKEVLLTGAKSSNDSTFTIHKFEESYKFVFGHAEPDNSTDVGLDGINQGIWRLILLKNSDFGVTFFPELELGMFR